MINFNIPIKGNRTIATIGLYLGYQVAVNHGWIQPLQEIDYAFKGAIIIFFKKGIEDALKDASGTSTTTVQGDQTVNVAVDKVEVKEVKEEPK